MEPWRLCAVLAVAIFRVASMVVNFHVGMLWGTASQILILPGFATGLTTAHVLAGAFVATAALAPASPFAVRSAWIAGDRVRLFLTFLVGASCLFWNCFFAHQLFLIEQASTLRAAQSEMKVRDALEADLITAEDSLFLVRAVPVPTGRSAQAACERKARATSIEAAEQHLAVARAHFGEGGHGEFAAPVAGVDWAFAILLSCQCFGSDRLARLRCRGRFALPQARHDSQ
jgi:hypothetical protein